jgi:hypothetical protein
MRKLVPLGAALIASTAALAGPELSSYRFDAQLAYRAGDGTLVTLLPDAVFVGWGDGGCELENQTSERLSVYPDGIIQLTIEKMLTTTQHMGVRPSGGSSYPIGPAVETVKWPCYRFRVDGCDDAIVKFGPKPPDPDIELSCPGREKSRRVDG